ncbi:hypothetical protein IQ13_2196 [Lacibacter cauensis]|uniref:Uncharacterized protein n=1 Tax=Lacibacter cauensis TaxID=510947 RepID=A0A562SK75_9BACT|nr:hypothetical protein [Lacibacter cauensis]TWI81180.1 hypothetical protein IQ13_2196 [Lacibacter cauensis]
MTRINQLLQEFAKTRSQEDQDLLTALVNNYEASQSLFDMYPITEIVNHFISQIRAIADQLPEERYNAGIRNEIQNGLYFNVEMLQQLVLINKRVEHVSKHDVELRTDEEVLNGALAYSKIMMQRSLQMTDERSN